MHAAKSVLINYLTGLTVVQIFRNDRRDGDECMNNIIYKCLSRRVTRSEFSA